MHSPAFYFMTASSSPSFIFEREKKNIAMRIAKERASKKISFIAILDGSVLAKKKKGEREWWDEKREKVSIWAVKKCIGQPGCAKWAPREIHPPNTKKNSHPTRRHQTPMPWTNYLAVVGHRLVVSQHLIFIQKMCKI